MAKSKSVSRAKSTSKRLSGDLPKLTILATCDGISRDPNTGKATLYGLFDRITVKELPATAQFNIYARMTGGSGQHEASLEFITPDGKKASPDSPPFTFEAEANATVEMHMLAIGLVLQTEGEYSISAKCDGRTLGTSPVRVVKGPKK